MSTTIRRPRALLLHGDRKVARRLRRALRACGFEVRCARDGERGLGLLLDELLDLDVLLLDLDLPGRDGWSFLRLVRGAGGERDLRVVMLGRVDVARRAQLLALGADAVAEPAAGAEVAARVAAEVGRAVAPEAAGRSVHLLPALVA